MAHLLNARRRHRLGHKLSPRAYRVLATCSTPEGVIVWVTSSTTGNWKLHSSCSTPEGVIVWVTRVGLDHTTRDNLLNARRRHRLGHRNRVDHLSQLGGLLNARRRHRLGHGADSIRATASANSAQRPKASSSGSHGSRRGINVGRSLLNARRRHRLGHASRSASVGAGRCCSTPEGVIVWVTLARS